jgi:glycosyltransferase involved in cell wall biosynthesis
MKPKKMIFVGSSEFPFGSAGTARLTQLALLFKKQNIQIQVINRFGCHKKQVANINHISTYGTYKEIPYFFCSLIYYRPDNFLTRNFFKIIGMLIELLTIAYYKLILKTKFGLVYTTQIKKLKYYSFIFKILRIKIIYDYNEYVDALSYRGYTDIKMIRGNFDNKFHNYINSCIVISPTLENHFKNISSEKPYCRIPPGIDFNNKIESLKSNEKFFLYCGGIGYYEIIVFIIDAYSKISDFSFKLKIITFGSEEKISELKNYIIKSDLNNHIEILSKLKYELLLSYYKSAKALLLPLTENVQDNARFPFKLCEYTASKTVIVSSKTELIKSYFKDKKSALLAKVNDQEDFSRKLEFIIENPREAEKIGKAGYEVGKMNFNVNEQKLSTSIYTV